MPPASVDKLSIKILYVAADERERHAFLDMVREKEMDYQVTFAATLDEARAYLAELCFDVLIADYRLPDGDCRDLCVEIYGTPCIVLAGTNEEQARIGERRQTDISLLKDSEGQYLESIPFAVEKMLRREHATESESRRTEKLLENEELRRLAEAAGGVGSFDFNIQTGEARVSPELLAIYGVEPDSVESRRDAWIERVHPDDRRKIEAAIQAFQPDSPMWSCEFRIIRPDGEVRWVESRARTIFDSQGNPSRAIGVNVDITDRKKSLETLRESETFYRTLIETLPVTVVLANNEGKVTYISPAAKEMFGLEPSEGLGTGPTDWIAPEHHDVVLQRMRMVMVELQPPTADRI